MLYAGLDLSRKRLDFHLLDGEGATVEVGAAPPDADGLRGLTRAARSSRRADPRGDRVDERRPLRARPARARRLAGRDRRRAEGEGAGAAGLQDRPDRRLGAGRARPPRSGAGDLAARPARARRARAGALAAASRPPPLEPEAARARGPAHARQALPGLRSVRRRAAASCSPGSALPEPWQGTIEASLRLIDELDREISELRARAAPARRRPPLRAAAADRARDRLGARLHDRRRDRRHQPLPHPTQARRLHRPLPARLPIRRTRPARPAHQAGPALPALGARRSRHPRLHRTRLPRPLPAHESPASASNAAPRSPRSTSPADSPKRSGTCSPATQPFAPKGATDPLAA